MRSGFFGDRRIREQIPEIHDLWLPPAACSYGMAVVSINKRYPGQTRRVMMPLLGLSPKFSYTKMIVVVDADVNPASRHDIAWALATRMDPARDVMLLDNTPMDYLDFASPPARFAGKLGIDATIKIDSKTSRQWGTVMYTAPDDAQFAADLIARLKL